MHNKWLPHEDGFILKFGNMYIFGWNYIHIYNRLDDMGSWWITTKSSWNNYKILNKLQKKNNKEKKKTDVP